MNEAIPTDAQAKPSNWTRRGLRLLGLLTLNLALMCLTFWTVAALYFDLRVPWLRVPLAAIYALAVLAVWIFVKPRWLARGLTAGGFVLVLGGWSTLRPSNDRDWQPDLAVLAYADIDGNKMTVHNIRNCDYRTETDFDVRHYDKTYDLQKLRTLDLYMVYWGAPYMAHTMMSFGFEAATTSVFPLKPGRPRAKATPR